MAEQKKYYFSDGKEVFGPYTAVQLRQYALAGHVTPQSFVCVGESGDWVPASKINGLFDATGQAIGPQAGGQNASGKGAWKTQDQETQARSPGESQPPVARPVQQNVPIAPRNQPEQAQPVIPVQPVTPVQPAAQVTPTINVASPVQPQADAGVAPVVINSDTTALPSAIGRIKSLPPGSWLEPLARAISEPFGSGVNRAKIWRFAITTYALAIATYPLSYIIVITAYQTWSAILKTNQGVKFFFTILLSQVIAAIFMFLGHYIIQKMSEPNEAILERPFKTKDVKPYYCVGVALAVGGILFFLLGIWQGMMLDDYRFLVFMWLIGIGFYSAASFLFHPERLFITEAADATPADSALSFLAFWFKLPILVLPASIAVASCISIFLNVTGSFLQLVIYFNIIRGSAFSLAYAYSPYAIPWILGALGILPLVAFFVASISSIFIDVVNSIYQIAKNTE